MSQMGNEELEKLKKLRQRILAGTKKLRTMSIAQCKYYRQYLKNHHPQKKAEYGAICQSILRKERRERWQTENPIKSLDYYIKLHDEKKKMKPATPVNQQPFLANVNYPEIIVEPLVDKPTIPLSVQEYNQKMCNEETTFWLTRSSSNNSEEQKIEVVNVKEKKHQDSRYYNIKLMQSEENSKKQSVQYNTWDDYLNEEEDTPFLKKHLE